MDTMRVVSFGEDLEFLRIGPRSETIRVFGVHPLSYSRETFAFTDQIPVFGPAKKHRPDKQWIDWSSRGWAQCGSSRSRVASAA
jgi:hypothetical protein